MALNINKNNGFRILLVGIIAFSALSFLYLNVCANTTANVAQYLGEINYKAFNFENMVLPDLHILESGIQRIMDLILARV